MSHGTFGTRAFHTHFLRLVRSKVLRCVRYLGMAATLVYPPSEGFSQFDGVNLGGPCTVGEGAASRSRNIYDNRAGAAESVVVCGAEDSMLDKRPIVWWEKFTRADRDPNEHFDNGVAYLQLSKDGGNANAVSLTASVIQTGGTGDSIAVHGRATGYTPESKAFAGWFYAYAPQPFHQMTGVEINLRNNGADSPWVAHGFPKATSVGLNVSMADRSTFPGTHALYIGAQTGARGWRTGIFVPENAIEPTDPAGNGEAMRFNGGLVARFIFRLDLALAARNPSAYASSGCDPDMRCTPLGRSLDNSSIVKQRSARWLPGFGMLRLQNPDCENPKTATMRNLNCSAKWERRRATVFGVYLNCVCARTAVAAERRRHGTGRRKRRGK